MLESWMQKKAATASQGIGRVSVTSHLTMWLRFWCVPQIFHAIQKVCSAVDRVRMDFCGKLSRHNSRIPLWARCWELIQRVFKQRWVCCRKGKDDHVTKELPSGGLDVAPHALDALGNIPFPIFLLKVFFKALAKLAVIQTSLNLVYY